MMPKVLTELLARDMDRKEFLVLLGTLVLLLTGVKGLYKSLDESLGSARRVHGFGAGPYGGEESGTH